ncbi:MAG: alanine racemase [Alistipes sp.]|nr:alanine racemase [Alistipes sp.]
MRYLLSDIATICGGRLLGRDIEVGSVVTDSRSYAVTEDTLFVAMRGVNHDAHDFVEQMVGRGVRAFMTEREVEVPPQAGVVVVDSALTALQRLAAHRRQQFRGKVVGIAGSNGKTVVKEWIAQSVPHDVRLFRSPRSYNSQLGVALSLMMMPDGCDVAIIEAGISQPDEMRRLEQMIRPDVVIFTSIGDAHQENFDSVQQKVDEKLLLASSADTIIYHSDYKALAGSVEARYGDRSLVDAAQMPRPQMKDVASVRNAQEVAAFCCAMGYPMGDALSLQPVAMRLEVKQGINGSLLLDDSYNADINSLSIALDYLRSVAGERRKVVILSDILQSAMSDKMLYGAVARMVEDAGVDMFIGVGAKISASRREFSDDARFFDSTEQLLRHIGDMELSQAAILVKGNRAAQIERVSHRLELKSHTTVLEVNLQAMARNINYFRSHIGGDTKLVAMVKASGYGAGDAEIAQMLQAQGISYLAVAFADEGVELREHGITMPIVVLNADEESFDVMASASLEPEIYSMRSLEAFLRAVNGYGAHNYPVHLKFDTGMHRLGFNEAEVPALLARLDECADRLRVASLFTHLCVADDPSQDDFTREQIARFERISLSVADHLPYKVLRHAAASAAMLRFPEARFDMCRLGLGLYGFGYEHNDNLEMVSTLRTRIVQIRTLDAGETVGYGRSGVLSRRSRIATIPVGYADGLDRHLGCGRWSMMVGGCPAPTVGRICMDSCMIDVTDVEGVVEGDEVAIFSPMRGNTAEDMARVLDTIPYEVLTSVAKRVKRIYINE